MPYGSGIDSNDIYTITGLSAGALNVDLVPSTDVSQWRWIVVSIGNDSYSGLLTPQWSNDEVTWENLKMYPMTTLDAGDVSASGTAATNAALGSFVSFKFFRMRMTAYTSGAATGTFQMYANGLPGFQMLISYTRLLSSPGQQIGFVNNDGTQNFAIAAGKASDTAVSLTGGMLARILVTTVGTHEMVFYDNPAAASGDIVGIVPASTARGTIIVCKAPVSSGIFAAGDSNNPGVTIFF